MSLWASLFEKLADRLGWELQEKNCRTDEYGDVGKSFNLTASIANRVATLTMMDSGASISGDSARAKFLAEFLQEYLDETMSVAAEVALGTGDALVKPWTDGKRLGVDIVSNEDFRVCGSIGNHIKSILIRCDEMDVGNSTYTRFEGQRLSEVEGIPTLFIEQFVYKNEEELTDKAQWPAAWQELNQVEYIPNVDQLLLGRYKCPTVNRQDVNSENGVKITYGLDKVMQKAAESYERFNSEMEKKETMLFVDRTLFKKDENGQRTLPVGKHKLFQQVSAKDKESKELVHEYSPDMRTEQLEAGMEVNFRMLELMAGLSHGILTKPTTNFATATEIKNSLQLTFAFMTNFRKRLVKGTTALLRAVDILCNVNNITPMGNWDVQFDWSSSYVECLEEQFNRLVQAEAIDAVEPAEVRAYVMDEDLETASQRVEEIKSKAKEVNDDGVQ